MSTQPNYALDSCLCAGFHRNPPCFTSRDLEAYSELIALAVAAGAALAHKQIAAYRGGVGFPATQQRCLAATLRNNLAPPQSAVAQVQLWARAATC